MEGRPEGLVTGDLLVVGVILVIYRGDQQAGEVCVVAWRRGHLVPPSCPAGTTKRWTTALSCACS